MNKTNPHWKVTIGQDGRVFYADTWRKVMTWINRTLPPKYLGEWHVRTLQSKLLTGDDIKYWNEIIDQRQHICIEHVLDLKRHLIERRTFLNVLRKIEDYMSKAQRQPGLHTEKARRYMNRFHSLYAYAEYLVEKHPTIWHGEI